MISFGVFNLKSAQLAINWIGNILLVFEDQITRLLIGIFTNYGLDWFLVSNA